MRLGHERNNFTCEQLLHGNNPSHMLAQRARRLFLNLTKHSPASQMCEQKHKIPTHFM